MRRKPGSMDLTQIPGIGPAYEARLQDAGIADVAALAEVEDLSTLSEATGIATSRLAEFQAHAIQLHDPSGIIVMDPFQEAAQQMVRAADQLASEVSEQAAVLHKAIERQGGVRMWLRRKTAEALRAASEGLGRVREGLSRARTA